MEDDYTTEELREREKLIASIVSGLGYIEDHGISDEDLDELLKKTNEVFTNLKYIEDSNVDVEDLHTKTNEVFANLKYIEEHKDEVDAA